MTGIFICMTNNSSVLVFILNILIFLKFICNFFFESFFDFTVHNTIIACIPFIIFDGMSAIVVLNTIHIRFLYNTVPDLPLLTLSAICFPISI